MKIKVNEIKRVTYFPFYGSIRIPGYIVETSDSIREIINRSCNYVINECHKEIDRGDRIMITTEDVTAYYTTKGRRVDF